MLAEPKELTVLSPDYSTTRLVSHEPPVIEEPPDASFKTVLFLPEGEGRQGEGGLRTKGYFKHSLPDKPLITVITVVFNGEKYLEETILSVINQTYDNVEYIIIDGGSTDRTLDIIRKYENAIDYWVSEKDGGIYDAMNRALNLSKGNYYLVVGSDDYLYPNAIEKYQETIFNENFNVDVVIAKVKIGEKVRNSYFKPSMGWLGAGHIVTSHSVGMLIRRSLHNTYGRYDLKYSVCADGYFIKKISKNVTLNVTTIDNIAGEFRLTGISNTKTLHSLCEGYSIQLKTESNRTLQTLIFIVRIIKNFRKFK